MRKILIVFATLFFLIISVKAQYVIIPDTNLRDKLITLYPSCFNAAQMMDTTCSAIVNETSLEIYDVPTTLNWDGYQYFKNLQYAGFWGSIAPSDPETLPGFPSTLKTLSVNYMSTIDIFPPLPASLERLICNSYTHVNISSLPASLRSIEMSFAWCDSLPELPASLDSISIFWSGLIRFPALPASLKYLDCRKNAVTSLPGLPPFIKYLDCSGNQIVGSLPTLPQRLEHLNADSNNIVTIPNFSDSLKWISICGNHSLSSIPALPAGLDSLLLVNDAFTSLPVLPANLRTLSCGGNQLSAIPTLPAGLQTLWCDYNHLNFLPPLPVTLRSLHFSANQLGSVPKLPDSIADVDCSFNQVTCLPYFRSGIAVRFIADSQVTCIPNRPSPHYDYWIKGFNPDGSLFYAPYNTDYFAVCTALQNSIRQCYAYPRIKGYVYNDNNNNGVKDADEPYRQNIKVALQNGSFAITNSDGFYEIAADSGIFTLSVVLPDHYTSVPLQYSYQFTSFDTTVTGNFALQSNVVVDDLSISLSPVNAGARPGFQYPYAISYTNEGTTTLTPNIILNYDNSRLNYNSSSNATVINNGSSLTLAETAMVAGEQKNFTGYFTVKPTAVIGDSIKALVSIHANAVTATDSTAVRIRGSFDPNDKSATPSLSTTQVANGDYIYYTIRFQNTGTDTAFNIVISDSLNGYLQPSTLQVMNTSYTARVTVNGDIVYCEFLNIHLPESNVNELKSHGFITFRIKPNPTTIVGSIIPNKAAIYFDFNTPIITAEAQTLIYDAAPGSHTYTFNGTGNWTTAANWLEGVVPPSTLQSGDHVVINGSCILNVVVTANSGSSILVATGKSFFVQGNLKIL